MMTEPGSRDEIPVKSIVAGLRRMEVWVREIHQTLAHLDPELTITLPESRIAAGATMPVTGGNCPPPKRKKGKKKAGKKKTGKKKTSQTKSR